MIYAVVNQKGGVGKTTTCVNLSAALAAKGRRILCVDLDPQGNATTGFGVSKKKLDSSTYEVLTARASAAESIISTQFENISILPARNNLAGAEIEMASMENRTNRLKMQLLTCVENYDDVLIDCPPGLGLLTTNALVAADQLIIPMLAEFYALEGLSQLTNTIKLVRQNFHATLDIAGILFVMFDARLNVSHQVEQEVEKYFPNKVFQTKIPRNVRLSEAPSYGKPVLYYDPHSKGAMAYNQLAREIMHEPLEEPQSKKRLLSFHKRHHNDEN